MLTNYRRDGEAVMALLAGAAGLTLAPDGDGERLLDAVRGVAQGDLLLPEEPLARLKAIARAEVPSKLDKAERALLGFIIDGRRDAEIARELGLSSEEVPACVARILDKLF
jgi:DNA-binding NarL/FixJ family response regulator